MVKPEKERKPAPKPRSKTVPAKSAANVPGVHVISPDDLEKHFGPDDQSYTSRPAEESDTSEKKSS